MKAIKALVIGMGVLIGVGLALVIYGISNKVGDRTEKTAPGPTAEVPLDGGIAPAPDTAPEAAPGQIPPTRVAPSPQRVRPFSLTLDGQPAGSRIVGTSLSGDRVAVTLEGGGRPPRVVVVDLRSGKVVGTLAVPGQ